MSLEKNEIPNDRRLVGFPVNNKPTALLLSLQWNDTIKAFEFVAAGGDSGSSEQFYQDKIVAGDSFEVSGDINAVNDTIEIIIASGKTAFLTSAKIMIPTHSNGAAVGDGNSNNQGKNIVTAGLIIDSVTKDKAVIGEVTNASNRSNQSGGGAGNGYGNLGDGKFNVKMLSLVGDGIKTIEIENILDNGVAFAQMDGYVIDT